MAYCSNCGKSVSTPFCINCGTKAVAPTVTAQAPPPPPPPPTHPPNETGVPISTQSDGTYRMQQTWVEHKPQQEVAYEPVTATVAPDGFFRTPFQVLVLSYATFGLYGLYWIIRGRRLAEKRLEQTITSYWWYLFWLFPIVALVSGIMSASKIEWRCRRAEVAIPISFGFVTFVYFFFMAMGRLPDPYWIVCVAVPPICIAGMHMTLNKAEVADYPTTPRPKFSIWEWIIAILGGLIVVLGIWAMFTDLKTATEMWFMVANVAIIVAALITFGMLSRD